MGSMTNLPPFIKREIEQLEKIVSPLAKKVSKYALFSFPLITVSLFNLFFLLFYIPNSQNMIFSIVLYAVLGALGFALLKEVRAQKKEIQKMSTDYIIDRINKSDITSDSRKQEYIKRIQQQPLVTINHFVEFLVEEDQRASRLED
ncbi:hypothetical protein SAMN05877753_101556 [Bacillus oleivorans]|uniref:Uncharacterized protein n=1 Tax=Bacillus oleivorans TaxID=1448271 RepID=A0A285CI03_9BACI|nr:DUF5392 family protein [Bacillus oleivorans]SNX67237.1 hypothetical protein SAMN05877753_101556 [Bacillus oleivorans]